MEDCPVQSLASPKGAAAAAAAATVDKESVVLDMDSLAQLADMCSGSPKMTKALSRKGSSRMDRRGPEEQEQDDPSKRLPLKVVCLPMDQFKAESVESKNKRFNRFPAVHPRKILLFFATLSSVGTMILIYCTLAIGRRGGS
ncbi:uncharacterized protein LOC144717053 [Wolffia australiana]